jgi:hypothetical protein
VMEARLEGRQPVAVTHQAATLDQALEGAAHKLTRAAARSGESQDCPAST